jgi:aspartyl protease family protein
MVESRGPWHRDAKPPRGRPGARFILWLALVLAGGIGIWQLADAYPGRAASPGSRAYLIWAFVVLALFSLRLLFYRRIKMSAALRNLAIWAGVVAVLVLGFTFQDELRNVMQRVKAEFVPSDPVLAEQNELVLTQSADGHFYVMSEVNGTKIRFLVDTGASDIALSLDDAKRLGIDTAGLRFTQTYRTANGIGHGAPHTLDRLAIGPIVLADVPVSIMQTSVGGSLLGMSFLGRLVSFEFQGRKLFLRWRE